MKLIVQIPCLNEVTTIAEVVSRIPRTIHGVDEVVVLLLDDGSTDHSHTAAIQAGADIVERTQSTSGLAHVFQRGIERALSENADIIVNIDADFQYDPDDISAIVVPILAGEAEMVVGNRCPWSLVHFRPHKRLLHWLGCHVVSLLAGVQVDDATCGLRAFTAKHAQTIQLKDSYTYTLETIFHAAGRGVAIVNVPVRAYPTERPSRLMSSISSYLAHSAYTISRSMFKYLPQRTAGLGIVLGVCLALTSYVLS